MSYPVSIPFLFLNFVSFFSSQVHMLLPRISEERGGREKRERREGRERRGGGRGERREKKGGWGGW